MAKVMSQAFPRLLALAPFVGLLGLAGSTALLLPAWGASGWGRELLVISLFWLVGIQSLISAAEHLCCPDALAEARGWSKGSPFQREIAVAYVAFGVLGIFAGAFGVDFWAATILGFAIFTWGGVAGQAAELTAHHQIELGSAATTFAYEVLVPAYLILLYMLTRG
ncbi:MAG TPA: DUF6790 family protein [Ktedonobacterales bacterium]